MKLRLLTHYLFQGLLTKRTLRSRRVLLTFGPLALILLVATTVSIFNPFATKATWYDNNWDHRKVITIDNTKVAGSSDLTDFPVLVSITDTDLLAGAQADGDDILFTAADGTTKLDHEIESYNSGTGALVAWVRIPTLDYDNDTVINIYYGNSGASNQESVAAVWNSSYLGVWNLPEDPSGTAPQMLDSTTTNADGTSNGTMTSGDQVAGKIGGSIDFDGSNDLLVMDNASLNSLGNYNAGTGFTFQAWVKTTSGVNQSILNFGNSASGTQLLGMQVYTNKLNFQYRTNNNVELAGGIFTSTTAINNGSWHWVTIVRSGSTFRVYVDGTQENSTTSTGYDNMTINRQTIGAARKNTTSEYFTGTIDNARVLNVALSADWITTEYNNQNSPSTFYSLGTEESGVPPVYNALGSETAADANLVGHWKFDENTGTTSVSDSSGNGLTGTMNGSITAADWKPGKYGTALNLDGTNDNISVSGMTIPAGDFTYGAWVYLDTNNDETIFSSATNSGNSNEFILLITSGSLHVYTNGTSRVNSATTIPTNTWTHVAAVRSGATISIYINGIRDANTGSDSGAMTFNLCPLYIGTESDSGCSGTLGNFLDGRVDDARVYSDARTPGEIVSDMNAGHPLGGSPIGSQVGYWSFDEQQGQTANSRGFASSLGGTLGANSSPSTDDPTWKTQVDCKFNGCLSFDGGDYVLLGNKSELKIAEKTITFWAKPSGSISSTTPVFSSSNANWYVGFASTNAMFSSHQNTAGTQKTPISAANTIIASEWQHLAYTFAVSGSDVTVTMYRNGKQVQQTAYADGYYGTYGSNFVLGAFNSSSLFFTGLIDEVKIYNAALTPADILIDMNAGSAVNAGTGTYEAATLEGGAGNPPLLHWAYDENTGATATDFTGNSRSGTVTGAVWTPGKKGSGLLYDGNDHVRTANNALDGMSSAGSMSFWFNTVSTAESLMVSNEGYHAVYMNFNSVSGKIASFFDGSSGGNPATAAAYNDGKWHHLAATNNGTTTKVYVDGIKVLDFAETFAAPSSTQPFAAGSQYTGSGSFYTGSLDDIKAFSYALSDAQIMYDYNRGAPLGWWRFDEGTGTTTTNDASGNAYHGTMNGSMTVDDWVTGKMNTALDFEGTNDYVSAGDIAVLDATTQMSVCAWVKHDALTADGEIVQKYDGTTGFRLIRDNVGSTSGRTDIYTIYVANGASAKIESATNTSPQDTWTHVCFTFEANTGTGLRLYINGREDPNSAVATTSIANLNAGTATLNIGGTTAYQDGKIDDVRVYNYVLSAAQILQVMNGGAVRFSP